jgi:TonB-dependent SusC/RagA subfamily outer membrane receptor
LLSILYGYYYTFLRNKKFHLYNRYYLLIAAVISAIIPLLDIPVYFTSEPNESSAFVQALTVFSSDKGHAIIFTGNSTAHVGSFFIWENMLGVVYAIIASAIFIRFLIAIFHINRLIKTYVAEKIDSVYFINTTEPGTPFSFFKWLFWNKKIDLNSEKGGQIFKHELFHIRQKHSLDTVFFEMLTMIFWINPFFHFYKKEIKAIHEFLADEFAIKENARPDDHFGREEWDYAELLLMQVLKSNNHLMNPFFHNQIKRRIAMITSSRKPSYQYLRKIMVLPVAASVIALFAFKYKEIESKSQSRMNLQDTIKRGEKKPIIADAAKFTNGDNTMISPLTINASKSDTTKPLEKVFFVINGKERPDIMSLSGVDSIIKPNDINSINVLKGPSAIAKYGNKGKNGVIEIITKAEIKKDATIESNIDVNNKIFQKTDSSSPSIEEESKTPEVNNQINVDNKIFEKVEVDPSFPGGEGAWREFLEHHLNAEIPIKLNAPDGTYTVWVQFIVDKEGNVSNIKPLTDFGYGMEKEALRIINLSAKWIPAKQNGHIVKAYRKQLITFVVKGTNNQIANTRNYYDPDFIKQRREAISEIKATARREGKAAYVYKGRTYVFARINNPDPTIASFAEQDGTTHAFLLNGELVPSIDEINKQFTRNDVIKLGLISKEESIKRFSINDAIVSIETFNDNLLTKK